ncbi:MAG: hypothetical protein AAF754_14345 [Pseudomonadota bacterium]
MTRQSLWEADGGACRADIELPNAPDILAELEKWATILKAEPEVIHRLAAFAEAADDVLDESKGDPKLGASFEEPAP